MGTLCFRLHSYSRQITFATMLSGELFTLIILSIGLAVIKCDSTPAPLAAGDPVPTAAVTEAAVISSTESAISSRIKEVTDALGLIIVDINKDFSDSLSQCTNDVDEVQHDVSSLQSSFQKDKQTITSRIEAVASQFTELISNLTDELTAAKGSIAKLEEDVEQIRNDEDLLVQ